MLVSKCSVPNLFGGQPRVRPLVHHPVAIETDGEGFDFFVRGMNRKIQNRGGIHAAAGKIPTGTSAIMWSRTVAASRP